MSDWSNSAAKCFIENRESKKLGDAKVLHDHTMITTKGNVIWSQLSNIFERKCKEFNQEPGIGELLIFDSPYSHCLQISRSDTQATLEITFLEFGVITVKGIENDRLQFRLGVINGTSEIGIFKAETTIQRQSKRGYIEPEKMADTLLNSFLS